MIKSEASKIKIILKELLLIIVIGTVLTIAFNGLDQQNTRQLILNFAYGISITLLLWKGNEFGACIIDRYYSWLDEPVKRLIAGILVMLFITILSVSLLNYFFYNYLFGVKIPLFSLKHINAYIFPVLITVFIVSILYAREFMLSWRDLALREEQLKRETISARFESLKNQVNPHFLFNSLNALSSLVSNDPETAEKFIQQLSKVYRYVLDVRQKELVSLSDELDFLNSYIYLEQIRFGNKLIIRNELNPDKNILVAPMALQMLTENAIKHNIISARQKLEISLSMEDEKFLVIRNSLNPKSSQDESTGLGLENIRMRYQHVCGQGIKIEENAQYFTVSLPVINSINQ